MSKTLFNGVLAARWVVLACLLGITLLFARHLWPPDDVLIDFSFEALLVGESDAEKSLQTLRADFGDDSGLISILAVMPEGGRAGRPEVMRAVADLVDALTARPEVEPEQVFSLVDVPDLHADSITPQALRRALRHLERHPDAPDASARYRATLERLMDHALYTGRFISQDRRAVGVIAMLARDADASQRADFLGWLPSALDAFRGALPPGSRVSATGAPVIQKAYTDVALKDLLRFAPVTALLVALLLLALFGRLYVTIVPMIGVLVATIWGVGLMQMVGEPINMVNNVIGVMVLVIGLADAVHIITRYHEVAPGRAEHREAIAETMRRVAPACLMTTVTTAVGFASLASAHIPAVRSFGIYVAIAIGFAFVVQMTLVPIMLSFVAPPRGAPPRRDEQGRIGAALGALARVGRARPVTVVVVAAILTGVGLWGVSRVTTDLFALEELDEAHPVSSALRDAETSLSGVLVHAVAFTGREDPDARCHSDEDCRPADCHCTTPGCCHTRVCRKIDPDHRLVEALHGSVAALTGERGGPLWSELRRALRRTGTDRRGHASPAEPDAIVVIDGDASSPDPALEREGVCVESVKNPAFMNALGRLDQWLESSPTHRDTVSRVESLQDLLDEVRMGGAARGIGDIVDRAEIAQLLSLLASGGGDTLARYVTSDATSTQLVVFANDTGSEAWRALRADLEQQLDSGFRQNPALADRFEISVGGSATIAKDALGSIVSDIADSIGWAVVLIFALLLLFFRSLKVSAVAMIPNLWPLVLTLGAMGLADVHARVSTVIIFSVALGIAVDDTIHYLARFAAEIRQGRHVDEANHRAIVHTGRAMVTTSLILIVGFAINIASEFVALRQFGIFASLTLFLALVSDLLLLPALARLFALELPLGRDEGRWLRGKSVGTLDVKRS